MTTMNFLPEAERTRRMRLSLKLDVMSTPTPAQPVAWVEIHGAKLHCPCGVVTDFTDHVRQEFLSNPEHKCEGCGTVWGTPAAADCEYSGPSLAGGEAPR